MPKKKTSRATKPSPSTGAAEKASAKLSAEIHAPPLPLVAPAVPADVSEPPADSNVKAACSSCGCVVCGKPISPGSCDCIADRAEPKLLQQRRARIVREFLGDLAACPFVCESCHGQEQPAWSALQGSKRVRAQGTCPLCGTHHVIGKEAPGLCEVQRSEVALYILRHAPNGDLTEEKTFALRHIVCMEFCPEEDRDHLSIKSVDGEIASYDVRDASLAIRAFERSEHYRRVTEQAVLGAVQSYEQSEILPRT